MSTPGLPLPSRRRAEEFARLLDGAPATNDPTLAPLATLATALRSLPLGPAPDFRAGLRQRLVAVATVQGIGTAATDGATVIALPGLRSAPRPAISWRLNEWAEGWRVRRRLVAATATMSAVVMVGGIGLAGSRSLPGDPFYSVKRGVENIQLAAARGDQAKGERHLQFARTRLGEVNDLVGSSSALGVHGSSTGNVAGASAIGGSLTARIVSTLRAMDDETRAGSRDLTKAFQKSRSHKPLQTLTTFASEQSSRILAVLPELPAGSTPQGDSSLKLVQQIGATANELLANAECTAACEATTQTPPGVTKTPGPGSTPAPCTCASDPGSGGAAANPSNAPSSGPTMTPSPEPSPSGTHTSSPPAPNPSPTPTTLEDQIGGIIASILPIPIPTPTLPLPKLPLPNPLPTINLP
ncbi:MAG: hypothetical protein QOG53_2900 [Frankiales bacterium]|jgi:hypothetical protein|nr:hypothetical protein [Frankiales bacterium]